VAGGEQARLSVEIAPTPRRPRRSARLALPARRGRRTFRYDRPADGPTPYNRRLEDSRMAVITDLYVYPVKSCRGVRVKEADLWETGLYLDRFWMVIDDDCQFVTQRNLPRMALIETSLRFESLQLKAPGMLRLDIPVGGFDYDPARRVLVDLWGEAVAAFPENDLVSQWFSDFLGKPLRLVRIDPDFRRVCAPQWTGTQESITQFADGFPLLVVSQASLADLNARLQAQGLPALPMDRFRPNVVIDGVDAYGEDTLARLAHAGYEFRMVKPCTRCRITGTDQQTAAVSTQPLDTLSTYRQDVRADGITFGMNAVVVRGADEAVVRVGDTLEADIDFGD
jgi:uncharacterized protein